MTSVRTAGCREGVRIARADEGSAGAPPGLVAANQDVFERCFHREPFLVAHRLAGHPLFDLRALLDLARRLPAASIEYNAGDVPVSVDPRRTPGNGLCAVETIRRIRECRSWMVLKDVEQDPAYRDLLEACLAALVTASGGRLAETRDPHGFIFVSSPGALTPYHMDPEHNFLLQLEGSKSVSLFDPRDRGVLSALELERFFAGGHRNLAFDERYQDRARVFRLGPGSGLHFPVTAPHWVRNGDAVSVSFSVTFRSAWSQRRERIYKVNAMLRRLGWQPREPGPSRWPDAAKLAGFEALRCGKRAVSRVRNVSGT